MANHRVGLPVREAQQEHIIGRILGDSVGPSIIVMTGIHGNEPAGLQAAERVLETIRRNGIALNGELSVLAGNLQALKLKTRFIHNDLNRHWTPNTVAALSALRQEAVGEDRERRELLQVLAEVIAGARGQVHFLDLHTSSADGAPFVTVGDTLRNRAFALKLPLPLILGLEEQVDGSLLEYLNNFGFITMGVEAGQHHAESAVDVHEAALWLAMIAAEMVDPQSVPGLQRHEQLLAEASRTIPRVLEVRGRHAITPEHRFEMEPGFVSFQPIQAGQVLARDRNGVIRAEESGRLLLPLYQGKGDDGFFIAREVAMVWLRVSALLRRLGLGSLIPFLPGVRRHPEQQEVLIVNTRIARFYPLEVFHLFGYRKLRQVGAALLVSRRRYDIAPPRQISFT